MNGGRAASAGGRARRGHRAIAGASVVTAALAGVAAAVAAPASGVVAATAPGPQSQWLAPAAGAVVWIAAQPNAGAVGLDPVASQLTRDGSIVRFVRASSGIGP